MACAESNEYAIVHNQNHKSVSEPILSDVYPLTQYSRYIISSVEQIYCGISTAIIYIYRCDFTGVPNMPKFPLRVWSEYHKMVRPQFVSCAMHVHIHSMLYISFTFRKSRSRENWLLFASVFPFSNRNNEHMNTYQSVSPNRWQKSTRSLTNSWYCYKNTP